MIKWTKTVPVAITVAVMLTTTPALTETFTLELKQLDPSSADQIAFRSPYPQHFYMQSGNVLFGSTGQGPTFSKVIKKEPDKYQTKTPFRGVASLGSQHFGFVLDTAPPESEEDQGKDEEKKEKKTPKYELVRYNRLLFDVNGNGDLTDDEVIKAEEPRGVVYPDSYANYSFPRVEMTIEADGVRMQYAFTLSVYSYASDNYAYASASLNGASYREGEITLDGKKRRVVVVDYNSNGRFDDAWAIQASGPDGTVYPSAGDVVFVDPDPTPSGYYSYDVTMNDEQQYASKLLGLGDRFYELELTPAGDKITLTASSVPVGYVTNPNKGYRAVVHSEMGLLKVVGDKSGRAPLPAGEWKLLSYTIDRTGLTEEEEKEPEEGTSLLRVLSDALVEDQRPSALQYTFVSARAPGSYPAVTVREGETVELPFGPPYTPTVTTSHRAGTPAASLGMSLVGSAGEQCSNLMVAGRRPPDPTFTITDPEGTEVQAGKFEYG